MRIQAILFDLDDTLVVEQAAADAAFLATCKIAHQRHGVDPKALHQTIRLRAREIWLAAPTHPYCRRIGISSWEGLWARFTGDDPELTRLREWAPEYRRKAWASALRDHGVRSAALASELADAFVVERRARHALFPDVEPALRDLTETYRLALITNGAPDLQREKLEAVGIADLFEATVLSGEVGVGKPDPRIFGAALAELSLRHTGLVMVGDDLQRDIAGARGVGIRGVWINRSRSVAEMDIRPDAEIVDLSELRGMLKGLAS